VSDKSTLSELARFIGQSKLLADDVAVRRRAINEITARLEPRPAHRRVADLLGVVLTLSARTRRMVLPRVTVELDVFAPDGARAARIHWGSEPTR
jgi:hypothetical protein